MSHLTAHSPATSVLKVRIWGDSGRGPVTTLPRGSLIATYLYYPTNFNSDYHSPILAGVPDGWSFGSKTKLKAFADRLLSTGIPTQEDAGVSRRLEMAGVLGPEGENGEGLDEESIRMQKTFVPLVLAEDVTVRKSSPNADWADTYVSAALSGVTELHGKWCSGAGCNSGPPGVMFQGGEEFWVYLDCNNNEGRQDCILSAHPAVAARRNCRESFRQICKPLGEFVHPPLRLSYDSRELISGVYIDPLTSKALRAGAGSVTAGRRQNFFNDGIPTAGANVTLRENFEAQYPLRTPRGISADGQKAQLRLLFDAATEVANQIPDSADRTASAAPGANNGAKRTFLGKIQEARDALDNPGFDALAVRATFVQAALAVLPIFQAAARGTRTGPGLRANSAGNVVVEDDVITGFDNISPEVFAFFGGDDRSGNSVTQSAEQTNALSGHGTALVA